MREHQLLNSKRSSTGNAIESQLLYYTAFSESHGYLPTCRTAKNRARPWELIAEQRLRKERANVGRVVIRKKS